MGVDAAITLLLGLIDRAGVISALITKAKAAGQSNLSPEDWAQIRSDADAAEASLAVNIKAHGG